MRHSQGDVDAAWEARRLAELALRHLHAAAVTMVLVGGPPASGKTTLVGALADRTASNRVSLLCTVMPQLAAARLATYESPPAAAAMSPWPGAIEIDTGIPLERALTLALDAVHPLELNMRWRFQRPQMEPD